MTTEKTKKITYPKGGSAEVHELEGMRNIVIDIVNEGYKMHHVDAIMQLDVTKPRQFLKDYKYKTGESLSFTGYLLYCLAKAVGENKSVAGYRVGKKVYVFDEVDVSTIVERKTDEGYDVPVSIVVRRANYKTLKEISNEIRDAQSAKLTGTSLGDSPEAKKASMFARMPKFLRNLVFRKVKNDAKFKKDMIGTVNLSSVGMFAKNAIGWPTTTTMWALQLSVGSVSESHRHEGDQIIPLEMLNATMALDHEVVDGGPATRFIVRFKEILESGAAVEELLAQ